MARVMVWATFRSDSNRHASRASRDSWWWASMRRVTEPSWPVYIEKVWKPLS